MSPLSSIGAVVGAATARYVGCELLTAIFSDKHPHLKVLLEGSIKDGAGKLSSPLQSALAELNLNKRIQRAIEASPTIFDLAGIAWAQVLASKDERDFAAFALPHSTVRQMLSPKWFTETMIEIYRREPDKRPFRSGESGTQITDEHFDCIVHEIVTESLDTLGRPGTPDQMHIGFIRSALTEVPAKAQALFYSLPGISEAQIRQNTEITITELRDVRSGIRSAQKVVEQIEYATRQILTQLDGTAASKSAMDGMRRIAAEAVSFHDRDVFGRVSVSEREFGILPLFTNYVEPLAIIKGAKAPPAPILEQLENALSTGKHLTTLLAAFGFGKSLTVRMLAAQMAEKWSEDPQNRLFPLFLHAPDILTTHATQIEPAVSLYLERTFGMEPSAAAWLWRNVRMAILMDSFDEVILDNTDARSWVNTLQRVSREGRHRVLLASRDYAVEVGWLKPQDLRFSILPFNEAQISDWLSRTKDIVHDGSLTAEQVVGWLGKDLAGTPILLLMAAWDWHSSEAGGVMNRTSLYKRFVERIVRGKWEGVQEAHDVVQHGARLLDQHHGTGAYRKALARIAWAHMIDERKSMLSDDIGGAYTLDLHRVSAILKSEFRTNDGAELSEEDIRAVHKSIVLSVFVRRADDSEGIKFAHKSFREYLCASYLVDQLTIPSPGAVYLHPGYFCLAETPLGQQELIFAADLLRSFVTNDAREFALKVLYETIDRLQMVLLKRTSGVVLHDFVARGDMLVLFDRAYINECRIAIVSAQMLMFHVLGMNYLRAFFENYRRNMFSPFSELPYRIYGDFYTVLEAGSRICYRRGEDALYAFFDTEDFDIEEDPVGAPELVAAEESNIAEEHGATEGVEGEDGAADRIAMEISECFPKSSIRDSSMLLIPLPHEFFYLSDGMEYMWEFFDRLRVSDLMQLYGVFEAKGQEGWCGSNDDTDLFFWRAEKNGEWIVGPFAKKPRDANGGRPPLSLWWQIVRAWWRTLVERRVISRIDGEVLQDQDAMVVLLSLSDLQVTGDQSDMDFPALRRGLERLLGRVLSSPAHPNQEFERLDHG